MPTTFRLKNKKQNLKNIKTPLMTILITQNTHTKIPKYFQRQSFFFVFVFSNIKNVLLLYIKSRKTRNTPVQQFNIFFYFEGKEVFLLSRSLLKVKKALNQKF
jgi:hypothetical protein